MKKIAVFCFMFLFGFISFSQINSEDTKIANLKSKISKSVKAEKLKWMDSLCNFLVYKTDKNPDSLLRATTEYAIRLDSLTIAGSSIANLLDHINNVDGKPEKALEVFSEQQKVIKKIDDAKVLAKIYLNVGDSYYYLKEYKTAIAYYDSTQVFAKKGNAKRLLGLAILYKAGIIGNEGNFSQASKDLQEATKIFVAIKDTNRIISAKNSLSILYSQNSFFKEAKAERQEAIVLAKKTKRYGQLVSFYFNAATDAKKSKKPKLQIENLLTSMEYAKKAELTAFYDFTILSSLITAYAEQGDILNAEKYLEDLNNIPDITERKKSGNYLQAMKHVAFAKGDLEIALFYGKQDLDLKHKNTSFEETMNAEKFLSDVYGAMGNDKQALINYKNFTGIKDSISNIQNVRALSYYQTIYETEKRDLKIKAQQSDIALLDFENRQKAEWLLFGGIGLIGIFGFIILITSRSNAKKRQRLQEGFSQDLIQSQENERTRVARELHDSVGQKLMLLTKKTKSSGDSEMESLAGNTLEELRSISRGLHPATLERLGPSAAIRALINEVDANTPIFFSHEIEDIDTLLTKDASLHLYRIIQEVLNNMVKHAEAKAASITIERKEKTIQTTIIDNGKGFEQSEKLKSSNSLGMQTLLERAKILHSKIDIKSQPNKGTSISLSIPL